MDIDSIEDVVTQSSVESDINMLSDSSIMYEEVVVDSTNASNTEVNETDLVKLSLVSSTSPTKLNEKQTTTVPTHIYSFQKSNNVLETSTTTIPISSNLTDDKSTYQNREGTNTIKKVIKITPKLLSSTVPTSISVNNPQLSVNNPKYHIKQFFSKVLLKPPVVTPTRPPVNLKEFFRSKPATVALSNDNEINKINVEEIATDDVSQDTITDHPKEIDETASHKYDSVDAQVDGETDSINSEKTDDSTNSKLKREFKQLQKMKNESKILTEFINDGETRIRKVKKKAKHEELELLNLSQAGGDNDSTASRSSNRDRSRSRSLTRNSSPFESCGQSPKDERSTEKNRRNMRSLNAEFTAKHQKFLQGIQSQQESDISDFSDNEHDEKIAQRSFAENSRTIHPPPKV